MVAIVGGNSLGLTRNSASVLGANGQIGSSAVGRLGSGVTVNAVTGNLLIQNQDELLTGVGIDASVMRTYNSLGLMDDDNGDNWRHSGQRKVEVVTAGSVLRLSTAEYIARYVNETTRYTCDSAGRLRFEVTTEGKVTEYRYNSLGQKTSTIQYTNTWYPVG